VFLPEFDEFEESFLHEYNARLPAIMKKNNQIIVFFVFIHINFN